ncbi:serine hydrolase domain-containing protein [Catenovulum maritimum]|uniref:Beta-lactamase n=1 Tax=Catenovulum maritimum TaxID=1513271 RepID=A0A0J8JMH2_9ALTE|nr:serine hydrolase domain-containing protein [Catenovulum maritimum]KMT65811.1 beta-lactamase [Catenovulum maritimum]
MKNRIYLSLRHVVLCLILASGYPQFALATDTVESAGVSNERLQRLTNQLNQYVDKQQISGATIIVKRRNQTLYHAAFGMQDIENKIPMEKDSLFRIASQTKALVSVGIMMLQEQGLLLLNEPVDKYLPEFSQTYVAVANGEQGYHVVPANRKITIRDLLSHTAGIGYRSKLAAKAWKDAGIVGWYFAERKVTMRETVKTIATLPQNNHPGEAFDYGYATDILGVVIEEITGQNLAQFIAQNILEPLKMQHTFFYVPNHKANKLAAVYSSSEAGVIRAPERKGMVSQGNYLSTAGVAYSGGAGLVSNVADYAKFLTVLLNQGEFNGVRLLSRKSVEQMRVNHIGDIHYSAGRSFGLGFAITEDIGQTGELGSNGEYGWGGAYHSSYWIDPAEELIVVYMTQLLPAKNIDDHQKIRSLIYQAIID